MVLELRPAHDPTKAYGFVGVVVSLKDLSASIWLWYRDGTARWGGAEGDRDSRRAGGSGDLPPLLKGFKAVPPLVTDINLSLDDRFLYVSCWGTGELRQYDVTDPFNPKLTGSRADRRHRPPRAASARPGAPLNGGPQMVEMSRDGRRVYVTNSLYSPWDAQFYPDGIRGWMAKVDASPEGGMTFDQRFFVEFGGQRPHQVRLEGGDASSDSYCLRIMNDESIWAWFVLLGPGRLTA